MIIKMASFGSSLATRDAGRIAYNHIASAVKTANEIIVFDFSGINLVTNSFADEVFGRLTHEVGFEGLRKKTTFKNISPFWASVIRSAIDARAVNEHREVLVQV